MGLILASGSPRRKELLECSAVHLLAVEPANIPEVRSPEEAPIYIVSDWLMKKHRSQQPKDIGF